MTVFPPRSLVVVAGTATEVGKTWVAVRLIERLRVDGWMVMARKPAQSGLPGELSDADRLAAATDEPIDLVCPPHRRYAVPMAPPMAAEATGATPPWLAELVAEVAGSWGGRAADVGLVELAGGVASPIAVDADGAELAAALLATSVVLVADAGLGTIGAVRLSASRLEVVGLPRPLVLLNRFDPTDGLHVRNRDWLVERDGFEVLTDVESMAGRVVDLVPRHCPSCGRSSAECPGDCVRPLDPERYCARCGRRLVVTVTPLSHSSRCKVHGTACTPSP